ncbi:MAG: hypothetical protein ACXABY_26825 [Candidatus Thorarchaeota archaeon]|jgi:hypothetical protein
MLIALLACTLPEYSYHWRRPHWNVTCEEVTCPNADSERSYVNGDELEHTCHWECVYEEGSTNAISMTANFYYSPYDECWYLWYIGRHQDECPSL